MVQRMSISIPDELFKKFQDYKGSINVSKICQIAISEAIQRKEDFRNRMNETPEMDEIIERLRAQKGESESIVFERARIDGQEWAKIAHYVELIEAVDEIEDDFEEVDYDLSPNIPEYLYERHNIEADDQYAIYDYLRSVLPEVKLHSDNMIRIGYEYRRGWYQGILDFWQKVKDKI